MALILVILSRRRCSADERDGAFGHCASEVAVADINITANLTGAAITTFTITNGGNGFTSPPTIVLSGTGYATCTSTLTNGVITGITLPVASGNNLFTGIPTVSIYGGGLPTSSATLNPYNITTGGYSLYQNIKRLRFDLTKNTKQLK